MLQYKRNIYVLPVNTISLIIGKCGLSGTIDHVIVFTKVWLE